MSKMGHFGLVDLGARASCPHAAETQSGAATLATSENAGWKPVPRRMGGRDARAPGGPYIGMDEPKILLRMRYLQFPIG